MTESQQMGELYFNYGIKFFETSNYFLALQMWKKCFELCEKVEEIIDILEKCFIFPNLSEFKENYQCQCAKLSMIETKAPVYEKLAYEMIFVQEDIWYILDKEQKILSGPVYLTKEFYKKETAKVHFEDEYCDKILKDCGFISCIENLLQLEGKKVYSVIENPEEWYSFLKIPNIFDRFLINLVVADSMEKLFRYFHENTQIYLPKESILFQEEEYATVKKRWEEEHNYRISKEGRNTDNILLSICIPSYNRGTYALRNVKELLKMPYDNEVEIIVSNNGSTYDTEGYEEISNRIDDSRIVYFQFNQNQHFLGNFWKVLELAKGKYALILSDEDQLILTALPHYLNLLKKYPNIGVLRSNNPPSYNSYFFIDEIYAKAGAEALDAFFLFGNYISGIIYKTETITSEFIKDFNRINKGNSCFILYPHMFLDAILLIKYDFCKDDLYLFINGEAPEDERASDTDIDKSLGCREFSKPDSRMHQHHEWIKLLNQLVNVNIETKYLLYIRICKKLFHLVNMVKELFENEWKNIGLQLVETCKAGYKELNIDEEYKAEMEKDFFDQICLLWAQYII